MHNGLVENERVGHGSMAHGVWYSLKYEAQMVVLKQ